MPEPGSPGSPCEEHPASATPPQPTSYCRHSHICIPGSRRGPSPNVPPSSPKLPKMWPSLQSPNLERHHFLSARLDVAMPMQMPVLLPYLGTSWARGPWWASAALQGTRGHYWGGACWWHRTGRGQQGHSVPALPPQPRSLGECPPWLTSPWHDSPLHMVQGGSLPEVLGVLGLPDCPEGRKKWDHCRNGFSPVGAWGVPRKGRPRQCQRLL